MHKVSNIKRGKIMENQYFDGDGNLFTSLIKSNIGTPYDSKISSIKPSPFALDKTSSTPGTGLLFKMSSTTPQDDSRHIDLNSRNVDHFNSRKLLYPLQQVTTQSTLNKVPTPIPVIKGL